MCVHLDAVRADSKVHTDGRAGELVAHSLEQAIPIDGRHSYIAASFTSVTMPIDVSDGSLVQQLQELAPAAPHQTEPPTTDVEKPGGELLPS